MSDHCRHCTDPDDPRHADPAYAKAEADCAFYENPENLRPAGPGRKRYRRPTVNFQYDPPSCGPQTATAGHRPLVSLRYEPASCGPQTFTMAR